MRRLRATAVAALTLVLVACGKPSPPTGAELVSAGDSLFHGEATCATCHGPDLRGTTMGPPLLDPIYAPSHHPDDAIRNAVRNGVQPHHWELGPMPALTHLDDDEIDAVIAYIRSEQQREGVIGTTMVP